MPKTYDFFIHDFHPSEAKSRNIQWEQEPLRPLEYEHKKIRQHMNIDMEIRVYTSDKAMDVTDVFHTAVHAIDSSIYSEEEKEAWAPTPPDYYQWRQMLSEHMVFLAIVDGYVGGFIAMNKKGCIHLLYTLPRYQNMGIATRLYEYIEETAKSIGLSSLCTEASKAAHSFFEGQGFTTVRENLIERNGVVLVNYTMEKELSS